MAESYPKHYKQPDANCQMAKYNHELGVVCKSCKAMAMPWGTKLPYARDVFGAVIKRARKVSILEGVRLSSENVVAVALVAFCKETERSNYSWYNDITTRVNDSIIQKAGREVFRIGMYMSKVGATRKKPKWYEVLEDALKEPNLSSSEYSSKLIDLTREEYESLSNENHDTGQANQGGHFNSRPGSAGAGMAQIIRRNPTRDVSNGQRSKSTDYSGMEDGEENIQSLQEPTRLILKSMVEWVLIQASEDVDVMLLGILL